MRVEWTVKVHEIYQVVSTAASSWFQVIEYLVCLQSALVTNRISV
jgi:hypothetical protein